MKFKRSLAAYFAAFFFVTSAFFPAREAKAVLPVVVAAALSTTGTVISADILATAATALIGGTILALGFSSGTANAPTVRVPTTSSASNTESAMPIPAAEPTAPIVSGGVASPIVDCPARRCDDQSCGYQDASLALCMTLYGGYGGSRYCQVSSSCAASGGVNVDVTAGQFASYQASPIVCPSGYSESGGACALSNARLATSDNKVDLARSGDALTVASDKDTAPSNLAVTASGAGQIWGTNSSGQPFVTTITPNSTTGGSDVTTQTQVSSSSGSAVQTNTYSIAGNGTVTGASSTVASGTITQSSTATAAPTVSTTSGTSPIVFPDDYARQGTAVATLSGVTTIANALTTQASTVDPTVPDTSLFGDAFFKDTFSNLLGWSPPAHSSACPTSSFSAFGHDFQVNAHCALVDDNSAGLRQAMAVVYVLLALFIVLRA